MSDGDRGSLWWEGFRDAYEGRDAIVPDHARTPYLRSDYFRGYEAGTEDRLMWEEDDE